jgi:hypothetical protein
VKILDIVMLSVFVEKQIDFVYLLVVSMDLLFVSKDLLFVYILLGS